MYYRKKFTRKFIRKVFVSTINRRTCEEKYGITWETAKKIKNRKICPKYTSDLNLPGELVLWGLTRSQREEIFYSIDSVKNIAKKFGITTQTVRNIYKRMTQEIIMKI